MSDEAEAAGRCGTCKHRDVDGECQSQHLHERDHSEHPSEDECLVYSLVYPYYECGAFWVGENFGCVHWTARSDT